jgi:hypothetical protein
VETVRILAVKTNLLTSQARRLIPVWLSLSLSLGLPTQMICDHCSLPSSRMTICPPPSLSMTLLSLTTNHTSKLTSRHKQSFKVSDGSSEGPRHSGGADPQRLAAGCRKGLQASTSTRCEGSESRLRWPGGRENKLINLLNYSDTIH